MTEDTKFPEVYPEDYVADWFKRCIEDAPYEYQPDYKGWTEDYREWFEKWFGQFKVVY